MTKSEELLKKFAELFPQFEIASYRYIPKDHAIRCQLMDHRGPIWFQYRNENSWTLEKLSK